MCKIEYPDYRCPHYKEECEYFKQLQLEKFENLNNRQIVESAQNLIYENSELYSKLKEKEQECEELKRTVLTVCPNCNSEYLTPLGIELYEENKKLKQECSRYDKIIENIKQYFESQDTSKTALFNIFHIEAQIKDIIKSTKV